MENAIKVFSNSKFGNVRIIVKDGEPLFCVKDVAEALGYSDTAKAIRMHCKGVAELSTPSKIALAENKKLALFRNATYTG